MMNIITIDPSLSCSAITINNEKFVFTSRELAETKTGSLKKWFNLCEPYVNFIMLEKGMEKTFSKKEIEKHKAYDDISNSIRNSVYSSSAFNNSYETIVVIEGYSYSSAAGPLIDLVTLGTLLRSKFLSDTDNVVIIPPSKLKLEAAKLTYEPIEKGVKVKKYEWRNHGGVSGGNFKKQEIMKALIENKNLNCDWINFLKKYKDDILAAKAVPKPIEDINDSKIMYEIIKNYCNDFNSVEDLKAHIENL